MSHKEIQLILLTKHHLWCITDLWKARMWWRHWNSTAGKWRVHRGSI